MPLNVPRSGRQGRGSGLAGATPPIVPWRPLGPLISHSKVHCDCSSGLHTLTHSFLPPLSSSRTTSRRQEVAAKSRETRGTTLHILCHLQRGPWASSPSSPSSVTAWVSPPISSSVSLSDCLLPLCIWVFYSTPSTHRLWKGGRGC